MDNIVKLCKIGVFILLEQPKTNRSNRFVSTITIGSQLFPMKRHEVFKSKLLSILSMVLQNFFK